MNEQQRRRHVLRGNKCCRAPSRCVSIAVSAEQHPDSADPRRTVSRWRMGSAVYSESDGLNLLRWESFTTPDREQFWAWIVGHGCARERVWLWSAGLAADMMLSGLWLCVTRSDVVVERYVFSDPPTSVSWRIGSARFTAVDTRNYLPRRKWPVGNAEEEAASIDEFARTVTRMTRLLSLGNMATTVGGIAWNAYRHRFMRHKVVIHPCERALNIERAAYYGGDCLALHVGMAPEPACHLDVNGLYPSVMAQHEYPVSLDRVGDGMSVASLAEAILDRGVVASVKVESEEDEFPARRNGHRRSLCGAFWTYLAGPELSAALARGQIVQVGEYATYKTAFIFGEWVEYMTVLRRDAERAEDADVADLAKLVCNALSGKWAQRGSEWEPAPGQAPEVSIGEWWAFDTATRKLERFCAVGGKVSRLCRRGEWRDSFPAISAYITSHGREVMRQLREIAGSRQVFYQDTDSLFCTALGRERLRRAGLIHPTRLGALKEVAGPADLEIFGNKVYNYSGKLTAAGMADGAVLESEGEYRLTVAERARQLLGHAESLQTATSPMVYRVRQSSAGRVVDADGWTWPQRE